MAIADRRTVKYSTLAEFLEDAEQIAASEHRTVGQWTFPQILEHLSNAMNYSIEGFPFQGPWLIRKLVAPFIKNSILTKPMKPGFKLPKSAKSYLPNPDTSLDMQLPRLREAVTRITSEVPTAEHPLLGYLAEEEWRALHIRHAELHMSFVVPTSESTDAVKV